MFGVFRIIKSRWAEVLLVVVLQAGVMVLMNQIVGDDPGSDASVERLNNMSGGKLFGLTFGMTAFMILWQMLYLGFLATAYSNKEQPQQPGMLVAVGRYFFWRIARFHLLAFAVLCFGSQIFGGIMAPLLLLALVKPLVLMPAIMIVNNCMVLDSFKRLGQYSLLAAKPLIKLIAICFGGTFVLLVIFENVSLESTGKTILESVCYLVFCLMGLAISLGGVIYIASLQPPVEETQESTMEGQDYE